MGTLPEDEYSPPSHHLKMLQKLVGSNYASTLLIRSYTRSFNGFAAKLSQAESQKLENMAEVVSVFPSKIHELTTTRSWDFVGFGESAKRDSVKESDIVVGVFDSGIWPESESFDDKGFGPPPKKWRGSCRGGQNFTCNNKLIGARFYNKFSVSARDDEGHGTHTASTAAGNVVQAASFYGLAQGTARGGVPSARLAAYKVCVKDFGCSDVDILAAFDDAISDGVDVISISISRNFVTSLLSNSAAIGSFHAMSRGIITVGSAGNFGPEQGTVANISPWMVTVAASATDRRFVDRVVLGNGKALTGLSVNPANFNGTKFPIVYGQNVSRKCPESQASYCDSGCVDRDMVKGKIVLCDNFQGNQEAYLAGATGAIVQNTVSEDVAFVLPFPASSLASEDYESIKSYIKSDEKPQAEILRTEEVVDREAPYVPSFSSRGPSSIIQNLLKPDVSAPGLEILAAFSPIGSPSSNPEDKRSVKFSVLSGTSMACPHVSGVAAYVKTFHPDWSPSAIKSAIMTTATPMNLTRNPEQEFAYGSGQINPTKASDPGLVYEVETEDYLKMLCAEGFDSGLLTKISGQNINCSDRTEVKDLNYPTMTAFSSALVPFNITFRRTVTNVGFPNSTYKANVAPLPSEIQISVEPEVLKFGFLKETKSFVVTISGKGLKDGSVVSSSLVWSDGSHSVRSPIVAYSIKPLG
ncbi:hypothetical protein EUTSA_v10015491mg [Eutrema salsugineum]|uniref:Subtilisin-like protease SBT4.3 n=1 Tax=Eutrema salsugineum TaxID=72664 RepID=V4LJ35_EUTSA|nr:subtilisin-like protease SBT4.3 [Eutrema salsugineum]ESQ42452.1 hypothetical protein EUTSA_v10015491mg [Eutrema salsugineum]